MEGTMVDIAEHLGLARYWAFKYGATVPVEDSEQYANALLGLAKAAARYDPSRSSFCTYATWWIRQCIQNHRVVRLAPEHLDIDVYARNCDPSELAEVAEAKEQVEEFLKLVPPRAQRIVMLRMSGYSLNQVADMVGLTKERIRQIQRDSIAKMREEAGVAS
jgi:RNA polymerase sigma factor (sigma-70 family)